MKIYKIYILLAFQILFFSCNKDTADLLDEEFDGPSVSQSGFLPGDKATRSSFEFDGSKLVFSWSVSDAVGIYTTAAKPFVSRATTSDGQATSEGESVGETDSGYSSNDGLITPTENEETRHPEYDNTGLYYTDPEKQNQTKYVCTGIKEGAQTARIASQGGFDWDENSRWTAYYPCEENPKKYDAHTFDFSGQKQIGFVNMTAYYSNKMSIYRASEHEACKHIAAADVMISPETSFESGRIRFEMRHIGAVARFFLVLPKDNAYKLEKLQLICESKIFYTKGQYSLKSRPYKANASDGDFGLTLVGANKANTQVQPLGDATNMLELEFDPEKVKIDTEASDGDCLIAYLMMYPITYSQSQHGNLYAYVTAIDPTTDQEVHFVTKPLADKDMLSGKYYQWTTFANPQDGLYPIELTATLLPWQDIVGSGIETDLEK